MRFLTSSLVLVLVLGASAAVTGVLDRDDDADPDYYSFDVYVAEHGKVYESDEEFQLRKSIFEQNKETILKHNTHAQQHSFVMGWNQFTDRLDDELPLGYDKSFHKAWAPASVKTTERKLEKQLELDLNLNNLPESVDWRSKGRVTTPVKNQGGCGSCWAFASTAALESHIAIQTGTLFSLSMQELVSCAPNPKECGGEGGCTGSTSELAYDFVAKHGIVDEFAFGYQSYNGEHVNCTIMPDDESNRLRGGGGGVKNPVRGAVASIVGFSLLPSNHYASLMAAVAKMGPVAVSVAASGWGLYRGGVYDDDKAKTRDINHLVVLEGYGTDQETGQHYWLIRNSWGPLWGEDGYIRLKRVDPATLNDPTSDCKLDATPGDGVACKKDDNGNDITPANASVCGTSGILFDSTVPIGGHLL